MSPTYHPTLEPTEITSSESICPDDMAFVEDAIYFGLYSQSDTACSDSNSYCLEDWSRCGGEVAAKEYFRNTACCETTGICKSWCENHHVQDWSEKCSWTGCSGCSQCITTQEPTSVPVSDPTRDCPAWCSSWAKQQR
eukprot:UN18590